MRYDFDMIVIGGGAAGLTAAGISSNMGAKTMMVESNRLGGDCTWHGCVPSKTLLHAAKVASTLRKSEQFGVDLSNISLDFGLVMDQVRDVRNQVYEEADHPDHFREMNIDVAFGKASFLNPNTIEIVGSNERRRVSSRYFVIATGSRAVIPSIPGLNQVPYLTNESLFELKEQPSTLTIVGGGPVGIEMGQAFQRLGTQVTIVDRLDRILKNDDEELAKMLQNRLQKEGIQFRLSASIQSIYDVNGRIEIDTKINELEKSWASDQLLVATGRVPNHDQLGLDRAGVTHSKHGIHVNDRCRTNVRHIYAAGDVTGRYQFTHMSEHMAKIATTNALLKLPMKIDTKHVPWSTYTDPELSHVGATESSLIQDGVAYEIYRFPYDKIDRAVMDQQTDGLIKIFAKKRSGKILGATIYGAHAAELISEYAISMKNGVSLRKIADTIHPYPSYGLGARRAADQWYVKSQSEWAIKMIKKIFSYRGEVPELDDDRIV